MKILCVCQKGNNRSVFLAYRLKRHGHDALSCGWMAAGIDTLNLLCLWAELIIVMQDGFQEKIPAEFRSKVMVMDVGRDKWGPRWHSEMKNIIYNFYDEWHSRGLI